MKVNFIIVYEGNTPSEGAKVRRVTVGATDEGRWDEEIRLGNNGTDATTHIMAIVTRFLDKDWDDNETTQIFTPPGDPNRDEALNAIPTLAKIAYEIHDRHMTEEQAYEAYLGTDTA